MTGSKLEHQRTPQYRKAATKNKIMYKRVEKKVITVEHVSRTLCLAQEQYCNPCKPTLSSRYVETKRNTVVLGALLH